MFSSEIKIYQTPSGKEPFKEWLSQIKDFKTKKIIINKIDSLSLGNYGNLKVIDNGLYELKIYFGPGYRVYFTMDRGVLILFGGNKDTQSRDIAKSKLFLNDYRSR